MKAWDIVGWQFAGVIYCTAHPPEVPDATETEAGKSPIFVSDEDWDEDCCDTCHWPLDDDRKVYGVWFSEMCALLCWGCVPPMRAVMHNDMKYETFPVMDGWTGRVECDGCGTTVLDREDEADAEAEVEEG